jgi:pyruvate ferredoxin oxidoreductase beta subunit
MTRHLNVFDEPPLAVGSRLAPEERTEQASATRADALTSGHRGCPGCGEALGARWVLDAAMRATARRLVVVNATGCLEVITTPAPESSWQVPWMHSLFGNAPAVASGVALALHVQGRDDVRVIAQGGDGATTDIGLGCLSGMFERNDDVLYVCYDNEAYMNTGVQRSSATPATARTSTTPALGAAPGNPVGTGKSVPLIAMAHGIPYVATASVADLHDLEAKVGRAMAVRGARYLHVPCPLGWGCESDQTIRMARLAVESGLFPLFEAEHGELTGRTAIRRPTPVEDYLRPQRRFAHLFDGSARAAAQLAAMQAIADRNITRFGLRGGTKATS